MEMTLDGETLSEAEVATLLAGTESLVLLRGQWVEVDRDAAANARWSSSSAAEELAASAKA